MAALSRFPISRPTLATTADAQVQQARATQAEARSNLARLAHHQGAAP
jgi:hypothetical protein